MSDTPMPPPDPRQDRILAAARDHFAHHGFDRTKLADIAKAAEVAVGTVYLRYAGKTELLVAVLQQTEQAFVERLTNPALQDIGWSNRFDVVFAEMFDQAQADPLLPSLMALTPFAMAGGWHPGAAVRNAIAAHLAQGQASGDVRRDLDTAIAAAMAHGMVEGAMALLFAQPYMDRSTVIAHLAAASRKWLLR